MSLSNLQRVFIAVCWLPAAAVQADPPRGYDPQFLKEAGSWELGPVRIYPALRTYAGYDDNIFESARNTESSSIARLVPELSAVLAYDLALLQVGYQADSIYYSSSSDDNFTDQLFYLRSHLESGHRHRLNFDARSNHSHEARGTGLSEGFDPVTNVALTEPDEFTDNYAALNYEFGARTAPGKLRFALNYLDKQYDNHRDRTRFFDRTEAGAGATFLWRLLPRTSLALEARTRSISYSDDQPGQASLDSREQGLLLGAEWEVTDNTSGAVRVGNISKNFEAGSRDDSSDVAWEVSAKWSPRSYSHFRLAVDRSPQETNGAGDFIDDRSYSLSWQHRWRDRLETEASYSYDDQRYQNASRSQSTDGFKLSLAYDMFRWLTWRISGEWRDRSSDTDELEFSRSRYWLSAEFHL